VGIEVWEAGGGVMGERFIRLTDLQGNAVWVGVEWIALVESAVPGEYVSSDVGAVVVTGDLHMAVRETVDEVMGLLGEVK
jgi:hypothetical protein